MDERVKRSRFSIVSEEEAAARQESALFNHSSSDAARRQYSNLVSFLEAIDDMRDPLRIPPEELATLLRRYWLSLQKDGDTSFAPGTLKTYKNDLARFFKKAEYSKAQTGQIIDILRDHRFEEVKLAIETRQREVRREPSGRDGMHVATPFQDEHIKYFLDSKIMNMEEGGLQLLRLLYFRSAIGWGWRGRQESGANAHYDTLKMDAIEFRIDQRTNIRQAVFLDTSPTKARQNQTGMERLIDEDPENPTCWFKVFSCYASHLPKQLIHHPTGPCDIGVEKSTPFFLTPWSPAQHKLLSDKSVWFKAEAARPNLLANLVQNMVKEAKSATEIFDTGHFTNHSLKKTCGSQLDSIVETRHISRALGHKNIESSKSYVTVQPLVQSTMSTTLQRLGTSLARPSSLGIQSQSVSCKQVTVEEQQRTSLSSGGFFQGAQLHGCSVSINFHQDPSTRHASPHENDEDNEF